MDELDYIQYTLPENTGTVQVIVKDEAIWCTQKAMAQLFGVGVPAISKHLANIFQEGELDPTTTVSKMEIVVQRGFRGEVPEKIDFYQLDAIIAVGYRVSSLKATRFRQWATSVLNSYIRKGFALDDDRLKELGGGGYWKEQPHLADALVAKNYLDEKELRAMGQIVSGYLDFAERKAEREEPMTMQDWAQHLDAILTSTGEKLLQGAGAVSHDQAVEKATDEYRKYQQRTLSDVEMAFLDSIEELKEKTPKTTTSLH